MLQITGINPHNNEYLDDKKFSVEDFLAFFGKSFPPGGEIVTKFTGNRKRQAAFGAALAKPGKTVLLTSKGNFKGSDLEVRYYQQKVQRPAPRGGISVAEFRPRKWPIKESGPISIEQEKELCAYLMVASQNRDTPLRSSTKASFYIYRPDIEAKQKMDSFKEFSKILGQLENMSDEEVRIMAMGLRVKIGPKEMQPHYRPNMTPDMVRSEILDLAQRNQVAFVAAWNDNRTSLRGNITRLINEGHVITESFGQSKIVKWNLELGGGEITRYEGNKSAVDALMQHVMSPGNMQSFVSAMESAFQQKAERDVARNPEYSDIIASMTTKAGKLSKTLAQMKKVDVRTLEPQDMLRYAIDNDFLFLDLRTKNAYIVKKGEVTDDIFFSADHNLRKELENAVVKQEYLEQLKELL